MIAPHPEIPPGWLEAEAPPLVLDLGCHRGHFLAALASERPDLHVLGVERLEERVERTRRKIQRLGLLNAAVLRAEIGQFVAGLPPESVSQAHILFPDPWPKRRHASRRLLNHAFIESLERAIQPGGALRILTDHAEYARQARKQVEA
ncbi:MAG: methyltransferase domain-containing protein, partial [Terrimicrobiaceae bacterium]|nr:methyltransferase domain-containing protein [Terrimicrobiaceae bacterium]